MRRDSNLKKLSVLEVRKQCQIIISKRLAALGNLHDRTQRGLGKKKMKENIKISSKRGLGAYEMSRASLNPMAIEQIKRHKPPRTDQILTKLIKAGGSTICSNIHKLTISTWNIKELPEHRKS